MYANVCIILSNLRKIISYLRLNLSKVRKIVLLFIIVKFIKGSAMVEIIVICAFAFCVGAVLGFVLGQKMIFKNAFIV